LAYEGKQSMPDLVPFAGAGRQVANRNGISSASSFNMVERFFRDLTENRLRRSIFRSAGDLIAAIDEHLARHNEDPKPFIWTKTAGDIFEKVTRARQALIKDT
jgi:hypothetical protein